MSHSILLITFFLFFSSHLVAHPLPTPSTVDKVEAAPQTVILLAHRWEAKSMVLDLKVDGTFEGRLANGIELYGLWEMQDDRKTLVLFNDPMDEEEFRVQYAVLDVSFDQLRLRDPKGKAMTLYLAE